MWNIILELGEFVSLLCWKGVCLSASEGICQINAILEPMPRRHVQHTKLKINHNKLAKVLTPCQSTGPWQERWVRGKSYKKSKVKTSHWLPGVCNGVFCLCWTFSHFGLGPPQSSLLKFLCAWKAQKKPLGEKEAQHGLSLAWQVSAHFRNLQICKHRREIAL